MQTITSERLREFTATLQKYKSGKASLERRVVAAENWWKLRNRFEERRGGLGDDGGYRSESGWLHNVIVSKHADAMEAYPEPLILPREPGDREEARLLSAILPCILEQNRFEKTYDAAMWQKLKTGTACYRVVWDPDKCGGLGDIAIERVDLLNLFWEPGVDDIQKSRICVFDACVYARHIVGKVFIFFDSQFNAVFLLFGDIFNRQEKRTLGLVQQDGFVGFINAF